MGEAEPMRPDRGTQLTRWAASLLRVRWLVRAPIWLYRARLGFIFGHRLLMLEHVGRRSGRPRHVVLEVVDRPRPDTYVVVSGFGARAQWLRNVEVNPRVRVSVGARNRVSARARRLDAQETQAALGRYAEAHPGAWSALRPVLEDTLGARIDERGTDLPMVALDLDAAGTSAHRR